MAEDSRVGGTRAERFAAARRDPTKAVLEGLHPLKHALRFGATIEEVAAVDPDGLQLLIEDLAPDIAGRLPDAWDPVDREEFGRLSPRPSATGVVAIASRPAIDIAAMLADPSRSPIVLLEDPHSLGNLGACVRVSAAADIAGVLITGEHDPWHPDALRGSAGLHYALPVARVDTLPATDRPLLALDPAGEPLGPGELPARALLAFGGERHGISSDLLAKADARVSIPMRENVSSLNLATAVAAVLFAWRLSG